MAEKELDILISMTHKNIIRFKACFWHDKALYIITEFCNNGDLDKYIKTKFENYEKIPEHEVLLLFK